jgi:hypothetical protein
MFPQRFFGPMDFATGGMSFGSPVPHAEMQAVDTGIDIFDRPLNFSDECLTAYVLAVGFKPPENATPCHVAGRRFLN